MRQNSALPGFTNSLDRRVRRRRGVTGVASALATVMLALLLGGIDTASARDDQDLIAEVQCVRGCLTQEGTCQSGCCGRFLCRKRCLRDCYDDELSCEGDCARQFGGVVEGAFDELARTGPHARVLRVSGPLQCSAGATADVSVTVTQASGPTARGRTRVRCRDGEQTFAVRAAVTGDAPFQTLSPATACGLARVHLGDRSLKALQWCREIAIVPEGIALEE